VNAASIVRVMIALMMGAVTSSETAVNYYQNTRRYNPKNGHLPNYFR
jgi:hypothetical protein